MNSSFHTALTVLLSLINMAVSEKHFCLRDNEYGFIFTLIATGCGAGGDYSSDQLRETICVPDPNIFNAMYVTNSSICSNGLFNQTLGACIEKHNGIEQANYQFAFHYLANLTDIQANYYVTQMNHWCYASSSLARTLSFIIMLILAVSCFFNSRLVTCSPKRNKYSGACVFFAFLVPALPICAFTPYFLRNLIDPGSPMSLAYNNKSSIEMQTAAYVLSCIALYMQVAFYYFEFRLQKTHDVTAESSISNFYAYIGITISMIGALIYPAEIPTPKNMGREFVGIAASSISIILSLLYFRKHHISANYESPIPDPLLEDTDEDHEHDNMLMPLTIELATTNNHNTTTTLPLGNERQLTSQLH